MADKEGLRIAFKAGAHARRLLAGPYCPFGLDCEPAYYEAWHKGWSHQDKTIRYGIDRTKAQRLPAL